MGITVSISSVSLGAEQQSVSAFSRCLPTDDRLIVDVAVVWDGPAARPSAEAPRRSLAQAIVFMVRFLFGHRPARVPRPPFAPSPLPAGWDGSVDQGGPREVLHSEHRRLVRVAGRDHPLPDDDATLVLLVRDDGTSAPVVRRRLLAPAVRFDQPPFGARPGLLAHLLGNARRTDPWMAALMRDPEVAAVLDPRRRRAS